MKPYLEQYSEKSVAVFGDSRGIKDELKAAGGKYNKYLKSGCGWIFPLTKRALVDEILRNYKYVYVESDGEDVQEGDYEKKEKHRRDRESTRDRDKHQRQAPDPIKKELKNNNALEMAELTRRLYDVERQVQAIAEVVYRNAGSSHTTASRASRLTNAIPI